MFILKGFILIVVLGMIPFVLGNLVTCENETISGKNIINNYLMGFFLMLAIFQILCVPLTYMRSSFRMLVWMYSLVLVILCVISICLRKKNLKFVERKEGRVDWYERVYLGTFIILFLIQVYFFLFYEVSYMSWDDYDYIVSSTSALYDNGMYISNIITGGNVILRAKRTLTSYIMFISYLSQISGFHTTSIAHTILPVFLLIMSYSVYWLMAELLFKKRENRLIFLVLLSVVNIFGEYSVYGLTFRLLATIWNGKAIVVAIGIPYLFVLLTKIFR